MIIGITGTDGAGKGTVVEYLITKGFKHYSSRELLVAEIEKRNLPMSRNQMRLMGNEMRALHGDEYIAKRACELIETENVQDAVIESIRAIAEATYVKEQGGKLIAVDADVKLRFERVQERRSESDKVDFETFVKQEALEKDDPDPHGMQKAKVIEMSDFTVMNNGTIEELQRQVDEILKQLHE